MDVPVILYVIDCEERLFRDTTAGALAAVRLQRLTSAPQVPFISTSSHTFQAALPTALLSPVIKMVFVVTRLATPRGGPGIPGFVAGFKLSHAFIFSLCGQTPLYLA